jgi:hypothetical protein
MAQIGGGLVVVKGVYIYVIERKRGKYAVGSASIATVMRQSNLK